MICPICKTREAYSKLKEVKIGEFNGQYFITKGTEKRLEEWWTCKKCTKIPTEIYIKEMLKHYEKV